MEPVIVFLPLLVAAVEVVAAAVAVGLPVTSRVGPPNWDYSKSWATNIAILDAVLGTFLSSKIVPNPKFVGAVSYLLLSAFFAVVVAVGPLVFRALSRESRVLTASGTPDIQYQGTVYGFLLAALLTLWAALGQLTTLGWITAEVVAASSQYPVTLPMLAILAVAAIATLWFAWSTFGPLLQHQADVGTHASQLVTQMQQVGESPPSDFGPTDAPLPGWRLL
jgi:hypothetical protein